MVAIQLWIYVPPAYFENLGDNGLPVTWAFYTRRFILLETLRLSVGWLSALVIVGVAGSAAGSVSSEHEGDTWSSLTATDLTGPEILRAKMAAAVWGVRGLVLATAALVFIGVACGSVHPIGVVAVAVSVVAFVAFAAAFGVWVSLQFRSTWRAQFMTISGLLLMNVIGQTIVGVFRPYSASLWPGFMPVHVATALFGPDHLAAFRAGTGTALAQSFTLEALNWQPFWATVLDGLAVVFYGGLAALLVWAALVKFERVAGRPKRSRRARPAAGVAGQKANRRTILFRPSLAPRSH